MMNHNNNNNDNNNNNNNEVFISLEPHYEQRVREILANGHEVFETPVSQEEMFLKLIQQVSYKIYQKDEGKDDANKEQDSAVIPQGTNQASWVKCINHLISARLEMSQLVHLLDLILKTDNIALTNITRAHLPPSFQSNALALRLARKCEAFSQAEQKLINVGEFLFESIQNSRLFFNVVIKMQSKWRLYIQTVPMQNLSVKLAPLKKMMVDFSWKSCGSLFQDSIGAEVVLPLSDKTKKEKQKKMNGKEKMKGKEKILKDVEDLLMSDEKEKEPEETALSLIFPDTLKDISCKISITSNTQTHQPQRSTCITPSLHTTISPQARQNILDSGNPVQFQSNLQALELAQSGRFIAEVFSQMTKEATQGVLPLVQVSEKCIKVDCEDDHVLLINLQSNLDTEKSSDKEKEREDDREVVVENPSLSVLEVMMHRLLLQQFKSNLQQKIVIGPPKLATTQSSSSNTSLKHKLDDESSNIGILPRVVELHKHQQLRTEIMHALDDFSLDYPVRIQWLPTPQLFISSCLVYKTDRMSLKHYKNHINIIIDHCEIHCEGVGNKIIAYSAQELLEYLKSMLEIE